MPLSPSCRATKFTSCRFHSRFISHREADVGTVEAEHELSDIAAEQLVDDVFPRHLVGGCRQGDDRDAREELPEPA